MTETEIERQAKLMYMEYSGNHPTMHCNRFPSWDELDHEEKRLLPSARSAQHIRI